MKTQRKSICASAPSGLLSASLPAASLAAAFVVAARQMGRVLEGQSLGQEGGRAEPGVADPDQVKDLLFGALRRYGVGDARLAPLLRNPPWPEIRALLLCALYRLETWTDAHTVVNQAVEAAGVLHGGRYKALVNGVLRNVLRQPGQALSENVAALHWHPDWWVARLEAAYPDYWPRILAAGNRLPPLGLRVNRRKTSVAAYLEALRGAGLSGEARGEAGILLPTPVPVARLPGFAEGLVSVQDLGAQRAAERLDPAPGSQVLDACAAPGGKSAHLLERGDLNLIALEIDPARCRLIGENFARLGLSATIRCGDASAPNAWGRTPARFDAILADVPCSASGVVRRHPDIKWLRQPRDVLSFVRTQRRILDRLWQALTPGGKLLYATCSVFPEENGEQIAAFLRRRPEAVLESEEICLPDDEHDGFYYALLRNETL
ncbi:MAG: 16S rRNA (cytosine(967)-C(5))-methyltransferase RsmB [Zoogloeaceae bacterium]|jgi:16S rRNA (cytosine967-C5)-methyltransferase|nr:16S rRNA (cytosine(967)-C(5))-methyltransferase RsmB [Zoogloeaceae bacterium]